MTGDFGAIEGFVGVVGAAAAGSALALRVYAGPDRTLAGPAIDELRRWSPAIVGMLLLLALGGLLNWAGRGIGFEGGLAVGGLAAIAIAFLEAPWEPTGPGPVAHPPALYQAVAGAGSVGVAILAVLAILLAAGPGPIALLGIPVGAGVLLLLGEPADRRNDRLRSVAVVTALAAATASVANAVVLRSIVPDALLLPLLAAAASVVGGLVGLTVDRLPLHYRLGVPAAMVAGVALSAAAVAEWMPKEPSIALALAAGWLGAGSLAYAPRWAVLEPAQAIASARAGPALGVIGSVSGGLRAVGAAVLAFGVAVWVAYEAFRLLLPDGTFGVGLAATSAAVGAAALASVRIGAGPAGTSRPSAEVFDVVATGWAALSVLFALPLIVPALTGIPSEVLGTQLGLGTPTTLSGLVLGATLPFLLASSGAASRGSHRWDVARRWGAALAPAIVATVAVVVFGPAAIVALVLGALLTGVPLGTFWAAAREATASIAATPTRSSSGSADLLAALDAGTGWRISAAVLATTIAVVGVTVVATGATGLFGL
ncbi:MAG: hypothetical protein L3K00_04035 [Thermoplasmata archaeon]|nr:hypothetical protein [Thermoplasmata archaeon]MCI4362116.1 hypothetical protein [Thermoplasmata archaeon]